MLKSSLVALVVVVAACGGNSPQDECNKIANVVCQQLFKCVDSATIKQQTGFSSEGDCVTTYQNTLKCATAKDTCPAGTLYDGNAADQCVNDVAAESCNQVAAGTNPVSCSASNICH